MNHLLHFYFLYHFQKVSTSCNESKEDITLDEVREKFFDLCSRCKVAEIAAVAAAAAATVEESDNN